MSYHGQWSPPVDLVLERNYFAQYPVGRFIECGAGDGVTHSCCLHFEQKGWHGINIEPCAEVFAELQRNRPQSINLNLGLSDVTGTRPFTITRQGPTALGGVTGLWDPKWQAELQSRGVSFEETRISTLTLHSLLRLYPGSVELLVLDVDGHELHVLNGATADDALPDVVCAEYPLVGLEPMKRSLASLGYRFDFVSFNNAFFSRPGSVMRAPVVFGATEVMAW